MRKWILILVHAQRRSYILVWAVPLAVVSSALTLLQPWPMKILVDNVLGTSPLPAVLNSTLHVLSIKGTRSELLKLVAISSLTLFAITKTIGAFLSWVSIKGSWETVYSLGETVFCRLQRRSLAFHKSS